MREGLSTKLCPRCGTVATLSTSTCLRCNTPFSGPITGQTTVFDSKQIISWGLGILVAIPVLLLLAGAGILHEQLSSTGAYRKALQVVQLSPEVRAALGGGIHPKSTVFGLTYKAYGSEFAEFSVTL